MSERRFSLELRQAMFWALLVARAAGEPEVRKARVAVALSRSASMAPTNVLEDSHAPPFEECVRRIEADLAARGIQLGSPQHIASTEPLPLDAEVRDAIERVMARTDADEPVTAMELFRALMS